MNTDKLKKLSFLFLILLFFLSKNTQGQTTISGIINDYVKVTAVGCNYVTVMPTTAFAVGDKVLIIQMQGATIDANNTAAFGDITSIADAGNFEINEIKTITSNTYDLVYTMANTYTAPGGSVQLIKIPQYTDVEIVGTLTAKAWDGSVGGVLVFQASGLVKLSANIDVSKIGFRGGLLSVNNTSYNCTNTTGIFASNNYSYVQPSPQAGQKGEGIGVAANQAGRGKQGNGAGGGNGHNTGGAGGGNYGAGGRGGDKDRRTGVAPCATGGCQAAAYPNGYGIEGVGLSSYYGANKVFMGGGGGGGHQDNDRSFDATNGGGIVIITANELVNTGTYSILATSEDVQYDSFDSGDGNSGAGAGGSVLLSINSINSPLSIDVSGGKGGDNNGGGYACRYFGPGGGGGGGVVALSSPQSNVTADVAGGVSGYSWSYGGPYGAADGILGATLTNLTIPQSVVVFAPPCVTLPVSLLNFTAKEIKNKIEIKWSTISETNNDYFILERSSDGVHYEYLATIDGQGNSKKIKTYSYIDQAPVEGSNYYSLKQYDFDGQEHFQGLAKAKVMSNGGLIKKIYPNPFNTELIIETSFVSAKDPIKFTILNLIGDEIINSSFQLEGNIAKIDLSMLAKGVYFIKIANETVAEVRKIIKE